MNIKELILKHSTNGGDYIPDYYYDSLEKDIREMLNKALELAYLKAKVKWDDHENEFDVIHDDDRKIVVSKKSIMSVMEEIE